jgi:hypothetical protein
MSAGPTTTALFAGLAGIDISRSSAPDLPTVAESGLPGFNVFG